MAKLIIEIAPRRGSHKEYKSFAGSCVCIGRSFDNDIVVDDPFVNAEHLRITRNEDGWTLTDLDSENGTFLTKEQITIKEKKITSGEEIIIGKTYLRFFSSEHATPPTKSLSLKRGILKQLDNKRSLFFSIFSMLIIYIFDGYMESTGEYTAVKIILGIFFCLFMSILWAGAWALIGRVIKHKTQFSLHFSISCFFLALLIPVSNTLSLIGYLSNNMLLMIILGCFLGGGLYVTLLMGHMAISTNMKLKAKYISSIVVTASFYIILFMLYWMYKTEFHGSPTPYLSLKTPLIKIVESAPIEEFITKNDKIFKKTQKLAKKDK